MAVGARLRPLIGLTLSGTGMSSLWHRLRFSLCPGGCKVSPAEIRVRQREGWITIPRDQVHAVKFRNISHLIVRLFDGRRFVLNLFRFPNWQVDRVANALSESQRVNEARRKPGGSAG
jgi:hypothetical protein